ncbi:MAG: hypothetical protein ACYC42_00600 [Lysobacter sp.]
MRAAGPLVASLAALLLVACGTAPSSADAPPLPTFDALAAVAAVRAAGTAEASELDVQPLRDPQVEDLRQQASVLETRRLYRAAADVLDQALAINPGDPALLQERAETALLLHRLPDAERYAQRALAAGSKVGPLCRRHWETIAQVRAGRALASTPAQTAANPPSAADARRQRDACTIAAPKRF